MNHAMKNVIRFAGVVAGLAAAAWALRDRMLPDPVTPTDSPPRFRTAAAPDDLTDIKGIGPAFAQRLADAGVTTFATLASSDASSIAEIANTTETTAQRWINGAQALL
ncbi:MAG: helix-hairpin-helix domain-containing protein [Acidimicrobiia bacterium]